MDTHVEFVNFWLEVYLGSFVRTFTLTTSSLCVRYHMLSDEANDLGFQYFQQGESCEELFPGCSFSPLAHYHCMWVSRQCCSLITPRNTVFLLKAVSETANSATAKARSVRLSVLKNRQTRAL